MCACVWDSKQYPHIKTKSTWNVDTIIHNSIFTLIPILCLIVADSLIHTHIVKYVNELSVLVCVQKRKHCAKHIYTYTHSWTHCFLACMPFVFVDLMYFLNTFKHTRTQRAMCLFNSYAVYYMHTIKTNIHKWARTTVVFCTIQWCWRYTWFIHSHQFETIVQMNIYIKG